jgi:flagellar protein FlaF
MFNHAYSDIVEDGQQEARSSEKEVIERSIIQMRESDNSPEDLQARVLAISETTRIWSYFLNDLASAENENSDEFRATLISIGIFIMKHLDKMRRDESIKFAPVREISETIAAGLR